MRITIGIVALIAVLATACTPSEPTSADLAPEHEASSTEAAAADTRSVGDVGTGHGPSPARLQIAERVTSCDSECAAPVVEAIASGEPRMVVSSASGTIAVLDNDGMVQLRSEQRAAAYVLRQKPPLNITVIASLPVEPIGEQIHRPGPPLEIQPGIDR